MSSVLVLSLTVVDSILSVYLRLSLPPSFLSAPPSISHTFFQSFPLCLLHLLRSWPSPALWGLVGFSYPEVVGIHSVSGPVCPSSLAIVEELALTPVAVPVAPRWLTVCCHGPWAGGGLWQRRLRCWSRRSDGCGPLTGPSAHWDWVWAPGETALPEAIAKSNPGEAYSGSGLIGECFFRICLNTARGGTLPSTAWTTTLFHRGCREGLSAGLLGLSGAGHQILERSRTFPGCLRTIQATVLWSCREVPAGRSLRQGPLSLAWGLP